MAKDILVNITNYHATREGLGENASQWYFSVYLKGLDSWPRNPPLLHWLFGR
jgi:hypothetical protein